MLTETIRIYYHHKYAKKVAVILLLVCIMLLAYYLLSVLITHYTHVLKMTSNEAFKIAHTNLALAENFSGHCSASMAMPQYPWPAASITNMNLVLIYLLGFIIAMSLSLILMVLTPINLFMGILIAILLLPFFIINSTPSHPSYERLNVEYWSQYKQHISPAYYQCLEKNYAANHYGFFHPEIN